MLRFNDEQHTWKNVGLERTLGLPGIQDYVRPLFSYPLFLGGYAAADGDKESQVVVPASSSWISHFLPLQLSALCRELGICRCFVYFYGRDRLSDSSENNPLRLSKQRMDFAGTHCSLRILLYCTYHRQRQIIMGTNCPGTPGYGANDGDHPG